jgi:cell division protein FtsZ
MAIMTGVQSAQILGPSVQEQAEQSRQALQYGEEGYGFANASGRSGNAQSDGGRNEDITKDECNHGLDVVR